MLLLGSCVEFILLDRDPGLGAVNCEIGHKESATNERNCAVEHSGVSVSLGARLLGEYKSAGEACMNI